MEEFQIKNMDNKDADRSKSMGDEDRSSSLIAQNDKEDKTRTQSDDLIAIQKNLPSTNQASAMQTTTAHSTPQVNKLDMSNL